MARLSFLRLSIFTLSKLYVRRLILFLNIAIFISFFAITATVLSIFFENKIDQIEKKIILNETNDILNNNWLNRIPKIIKESNSFKDLEFVISGYRKIPRKISDQFMDLDSVGHGTLLTERDESHSLFYEIINRINGNFIEIEQLLSSTLIVASNEKEVLEVEKYRKLKIDLKKKYDEVRSIQLDLEENTDKTKLSQKDRESHYKKYKSFNKKILEILNDQEKIFLSYGLSYFSNKKKEFLEIEKFFQNEINRLSNLESTLIFVAFLIQFIIFTIGQYFEITIEQTNYQANAKNRKTK